MIELKLLEKNKEEILNIIEDIRQKTDSGIPIIVEGAKDIESLELLGIKHNIITLRNKKLYEVGEEVEGKDEVIILTDFDRTGTRYAYDLNNRLLNRGLNANLHYWKRLKFFLKKWIKDIESMGNFLKKKLMI